jgi:hypothetical protein
MKRVLARAKKNLDRHDEKIAEIKRMREEQEMTMRIPMLQPVRVLKPVRSSSLRQRRRHSANPA